MEEKRPIAAKLAAQARVMALIVCLLIGLATAAFERYRAAEAFEMLGRPLMLIHDYYLGPIRRVVTPAVDTARRLPELWGVEAENRRLRRSLSQLYVEHQLAVESLARLERLTGLGEWSAPPPVRLLQADVTGYMARDEHALLMLNRGRSDGIAPRDPVVALGGLVGVVREVGEHTCRVQALVDPLSAVGVFDRRTRSRGVVRGQGVDQEAIFIPESEQLPVALGAELISSGFEQSIYPKGLLVGTIVNRGKNPYGQAYGSVQPAVAFDKIEEVLVLIPLARSIDDAPTTTGMGMLTIGMPQPVSDGPSTPTIPMGWYTLPTTPTTIQPHAYTLPITPGVLEAVEVQP